MTDEEMKLVKHIIKTQVGENGNVVINNFFIFSDGIKSDVNIEDELNQILSNQSSEEVESNVSEVISNEDEYEDEYEDALDYSSDLNNSAKWIFDCAKMLRKHGIARTYKEIVKNLGLNSETYFAAIKKSNSKPRTDTMCNVMSSLIKNPKIVSKLRSNVEYTGLLKRGKLLIDNRNS